MKNISITLLVCLLTSALAHGQIGAKLKQPLAGVWQNNSMGFQMTLLLNADGTGEFDGEAITYKTQGAQLLMTQKGNTTTYQHVLQGNTLALSGGDLTETITFTRSGSSSATTVSQPQTTTNAEQSAATADGAILGTWSGYGETISFSADGKCNYLGQVYPYQLSQGHVILQSTQGNVMMAYAVKGNQLTLTANGKQLIYTKGAASAASTTGGEVAQDLVGKWCWINVNSSGTGSSSSSTCLTLNADGTYDYYSESSRSVEYGSTASQGSDRGTWKADASRIYYNSPTRGQGSYALQRINHPKNGDPMIVLDGATYVTYYQKAPWR